MWAPVSLFPVPKLQIMVQSFFDRFGIIIVIITWRSLNELKWLGQGKTGSFLLHSIQKNSLITPQSCCLGMAAENATGYSAFTKDCYSNE
jgi:hypothetical protein